MHREIKEDSAAWRWSDGLGDGRGGPERETRPGPGFGSRSWAGRRAASTVHDRWNGNCRQQDRTIVALRAAITTPSPSATAADDCREQQHAQNHPSQPHSNLLAKKTRDGRASAGRPRVAVAAGFRLRAGTSDGGRGSQIGPRPPLRSNPRSKLDWLLRGNNAFRRDP